MEKATKVWHHQEQHTTTCGDVGDWFGLLGLHCFLRLSCWVDRCFGSWVTRRKPETPGTAKEHKRKETPTINPNDRQPARLTDQAPGTIERACHESSLITPTSTATMHAYSTATSSHYHVYPAGSLSESSEPTQLIAQRRPAKPHYSSQYVK